MKRTEKIEIRLSNEEKTALSELAQKEGRTISKLVRDLVSKYMDLNTAQLPQKLDKWKFAAMTIGAGILGFGMSSALGLSDNSEIFKFSGQLNGHGFDAPIHRKSKSPMAFDVQTSEASYRIEAKFEETNYMHSLNIDVCLITEQGCEAIFSDRLLAHTDKSSSVTNSNENAEWTFHLTGPFHNS